jgi:glycosyltransferase involved in cell wall biosynthesis
MSEGSDSTLKIGMVSRLSPDKGHEDLIVAFSKLSLEYQKKMILIIVGEDERGQKRKLENLIINLNLEGKIRFLDYVDMDSKKIILSFDLLLSLTKKYEGFGLSIAEAMSVGTPIIATNVGGVGEFFNNDCGKLIRPGQIQDIKDSLIDFCDHREDWNNKAKIAKDRIEKYFNAEIMGSNYMDHLSSKLIKAK